MLWHFGLHLEEKVEYSHRKKRKPFFIHLYIAGAIHADGELKEYDSHARVLISGLGADEQLGGYSRHREAFRQGSWEKLIEEVSHLCKNDTITRLSIHLRHN